MHNQGLLLPAIVRLASSSSQILGRGLDIVLPRRCLACGELVNAANGLCGECWSELKFLRFSPLETTAQPVKPASGDLDTTRSALLYDEASRRLILAFKHHGRIEHAPLFGRWMAEAGKDVLAEADLILPVPLHRWRLLRRGFNQSSLLAHYISKYSTVPSVQRLLVRTAATRSQQGLAAKARHLNITRECFALRPRGRPSITDARIVLIDDVLTTGATLHACAAVLKQHGARSVSALTLARAGHDTDML